MIMVKEVPTILGTDGSSLLEDFYQVTQQLRIQNEWVRQGSTNVSIKVEKSARAAYSDYLLFCDEFFEENQEVEVATTGVDLLTGKTTNQMLQLAPYEVQIIKVTAPEQ